MKDPLLSKVSLKSLEEIIAAAKETIHRHRRRFLQRSLRPCPLNCEKANTIGQKIVGCTNCGSQNPEKCIQDSRFIPIFSKDELAQQFADQLRNPEILLRDYRDVTVFLWVLGAFDKQKKTVDEHIVAKVEQREKPKVNMASAPAGNCRIDSGATSPRSDDPSAVNRGSSQFSGDDAGHREATAMQQRIVSRAESGTKN